MRHGFSRRRRARLADHLPILVWVVATLSLGSYRGRHPSELFAAGGLDWEIMLQVGVWAGLGLFAVYLVLQGRVNFRILRRGPLGWYALFVVFGLASAAVAAIPQYSLFRGAQLAIALLLVLAADLKHDDLYLAATFFILLGIAVWVPNVLSSGLDVGSGLPRLGTRMGHASLIGTAGAAGAAGLYARWSHRGLSGWGYFGLLILVLGTLASISRTAIAALVLSVLITSLLTRRLAVPVALVSLGFLILTAELYTGSVSSFLSRGQTTFEMRTLTDRTVVWAAALDRIQEGHLVGEGLGATRWQPSTSTLGLGHTHNAFLEAMIALGAVGGLLVLLILMSWLARQFWPRRLHHGHWCFHIVDTENVAIFIPLAAFCIMDLGFTATIDQLLLFYLAAMRLAMDRNQEVKQAAPQIRTARSDRIQPILAHSNRVPGRLANPAASGRR